MATKRGRPRGRGSLYRVLNGRGTKGRSPFWHARFTDPDGVKHRGSTGLLDRKKAEAWLEAVMDRYDEERLRRVGATP